MDTRFTISSIPFDMLHSIEEAIFNGLSSGTLLGYPILNAKVTIHRGAWSPRRSSSTVFEMMTANLMKELIQKAEPVILEPVMDIEISTPTQDLNFVMNDLISNRRGRVMEIRDEHGKFKGETRRDRKSVV